MKIFTSIIRWILVMLFMPLTVVLTWLMDFCRFIIVRYTAMLLELYRDHKIQNIMKLKYDIIIGLDITNRELTVLNEASGFITRVHREVNSETDTTN
jgi:hypothetical protein